VKKLFYFLAALILFTITGGCSSKGERDFFTGMIEASYYSVQAELSGRIEEVYVEEGDKVKKGDKIASLDVSQYLEQEKIAKANLEIAKIRYDQAKNGPKTQAEIAEWTLKQAEANYQLAKIAVEKGEILSPADGTVTAIYVKPGEVVLPGGLIGQVADLSNLFVKIYVPEKELYKLNIGKEVNVKVDFANKIVKGKVVYIASEGEFTPKNTVTKSTKEDVLFEIKVQILSNIEGLKPGMLADVYID